MASSRIFIKGLPPTFTDAEFKKHFSQKHATTDSKFFPQRRIGYVGYKTPEDAVKAVQYFHKSFIRMSRIGVEIARPVQDTRLTPSGLTLTDRSEVTYVDGSAGQENNLLKRKRGNQGKADEDPKLKEFLHAMKPASKTKAWQSADPEVLDTATKAQSSAAVDQEAASDPEYETVPKKQKQVGTPKDTDHTIEPRMKHTARQTGAPNPNVEEVKTKDGTADAAPTLLADNVASDADWLRSKTSRLLGLLDEDEETAMREQAPNGDESDDDLKNVLQPVIEDIGEVSAGTDVVPEALTEDKSHPAPGSASEITDAARKSKRLFLRNLAYQVTQGDLEAEFSPFGPLSEVHVPIDPKNGVAKGFAYVQFEDPDSAERALLETDGMVFQGRLLHVLPATAKREERLDDFALSKLPLKKQQQIKRRRDAASSTFNWNSLYMNVDAVVSSVADRLGLPKSQVLDPTSSDAAVKQAHAETHIIQETKSFFKDQGVDLDAFRKSRRGDTAILVKNIPYDASTDELKRLFEEHGTVKKFLIPPNGAMAIVEFASAPQAKAAFGALAYRKMKNSILFLEKAPENLFSLVSKSDADSALTRDGVTKLSTSDLLQNESPGDTPASSTVFVRNLNFSTTNDHLTDVFKPLDGFMSARVKTKTDPKKPGQVLSMGFGFLEFRSKAQAASALAAMDGYLLHGHKLQLRASHKGADAAEERRKDDKAKKAAGRKTKIIIKNLPFEASKKDVRALFGAYGELRSVRVPKKMDRGARGFAFADFTTPKEAESAMDALRDTHLLGRRLVLDFVTEDPEDAEAEIEKMQQKVGSQVNKVALQKLTSGGRKKFTTSNEDLDDA